MAPARVVGGARVVRGRRPGRLGPMFRAARLLDQAALDHLSAITAHFRATVQNHA
ncbi:hypothetical protein AB0L00_12575 [Actinoallomurus sp. NPDC052308]|uniref:hypothetical protein n=1 Tax=Actinoallomurus sp. NPDC052308 TaxID=3155530 RepID=UPI003421CF36